MSGSVEGEFQKRLRLWHENPSAWHPHEVDRWIKDAKQELLIINTLLEIKQYILKHGPRLNEETPIFSARHFASRLDDHIEKLEKWFGTVHAEEEKEQKEERR